MRKRTFPLNPLKKSLFKTGVIAAALSVGASVQAAAPETCNTGVMCTGTGLTLNCTISLSPFDGMASLVHFIGQQVGTNGINNNAICIQGNVTNTFTGSTMQVAFGINTNMFPLLLQARKNPTANVTNPTCRFVWKTQSYATTSICTINMADGLPVELMEFEVESSTDSEEQSD